MLSNGPANEFRIDGSELPSVTGKREGNSQVARAGRDRATFLTYGPYPYLQPKGGHYRATITYTYLAAPDAGGPTVFDAIYSKGPSVQRLDQADIPFIDTKQHEFTREIAIPENGEGLLQVRTNYSGSGSISIDSLTIDYLGK